MHHIGFSISASHLGGKVSLLEPELQMLVQMGCTAVEIPVLGIDAVVAGRLIPGKVELLQQMIQPFNLQYSIHAPNNLNLANPRLDDDGIPDAAREMDLFVACIELTAAIQGNVLVYHCGVRNGIEDKEARARELGALKELMPLAEKHGIMIGLENTNSGISDLIHQIEAVGSHHLRLTLDLAHLFLAARIHGIDYIQAIRDAAPWVCHIHHNDNLGLQGKSDAYAIRIAYGETDLHLPLGWGTIPHAEAMAALGDYNGTYILEIGQRFRDHWPESLEAMKAYLSKENR